MKWLKWHHKFSSGNQYWQWKLVADDVTEESAREEILPELADQYSHSEHYRGIDFEVVDHAPRWVLEQKLHAIGGEVVELQKLLQTYADLVSSCIDCQQCARARAPTVDEYQLIVSRERVHCPTCGREVLRSTLDFWLMPSDKAAVQLLGRIVKRSPIVTKTERTVPKKDEAALARLSKLGLVTGSFYRGKNTLEASKRGEEEWVKHEAQLQVQRATRR